MQYRWRLWVLWDLTFNIGCNSGNVNKIIFFKTSYGNAIVNGRFKHEHKMSMWAPNHEA